MKENENLLSCIKETFSVGEVDVRTYSPLALAFIGDGIYDIIIRTVVVERANKSSHELHKLTSSYVKAGTQAALIEALLDELTEEEEAVYRRGRNAKTHTAAKNASLIDYRKATGLEALVGYLYMQNRMDRILFLVKEGLERIEKPL